MGEAPFVLRTSKRPAVFYAWRLHAVPEQQGLGRAPEAVLARKRHGVG